MTRFFPPEKRCFATRTLYNCLSNQLTNNMKTSAQSVAKRLLDTVVSLFGLAVCGPIMVLIAIAIKVTSPGPVLYRGRRVGLNGRPFYILKFRSMVVDAERLGGSATGRRRPTDHADRRISKTL